MCNIWFLGDYYMTFLVLIKELLSEFHITDETTCYAIDSRRHHLQFLLSLCSDRLVRNKAIIYKSLAKAPARQVRRPTCRD